MDNEIASKIDAIELTLMKDDVLGFDPTVLTVLDNIEIGRAEIEDLKSRLGAHIFSHLFNIANSAYHGSLKLGPVQHFFDVVNRIGTQHTKALIILFVANRLARGDQDAEIIFAKNFAASVVGRIMARGLGFRDDSAQKVELACLLSSIGALMMTAYRNHYDTGAFVVTDDFIEQNHRYLTERIIRRFQLPEYLNEMIMTDCLVLERMGIGLPTVVKLAIAFVDWSFRTMENKFVFRTPQATLDDKSTPSLASIIEEQFLAAGMKKYLIILPETTCKPPEGR